MCIYPEKNKTVNQIIQQTVTDYGARAMINNTVLTDKIGNPPINKWAQKHGGQIGFQVNRQVVGCREGSANPCEEKSFRDTIRTGIDAGAVFIEVHDGDINRYKDILPEMNRILAKP